MNQDQYTKEQQDDINERVAKAVETLKELQLQPGCMPQMVNTGNDVFAIKLYPYLQDLKFTPAVPSPIQP